MKLSRLSKSQLAVFALVFGGLGLAIIHSSASSSDSARFEAESASLSGPAATGSDASASGGQYVKLNTTGASVTASKLGWATVNYVGWAQGDPTTLPWQNFTTMLHFSVMTTAGSALDTTGHSLTPAKMTAAVTAAHNNNKKILLAVGGAEDNTWNTACNSTNRAAFISNLINLVTTYNYDGIDLDIEQDFGAPAHTDYIACVSGVRAALNNITPRPFLTEDGDADWQASMLTQVWQNLDQIHVMAFGHTANTQTEANALQTELNSYTSLGMPASLLSIGIGLEPGLADASTNPQSCTSKSTYALGSNAFNSTHTIYGGVMVWTIQDDTAQYGCMGAIGANAANTGATTCNYTPSGGGVAIISGVTLPAGGTYNIFSRMNVPTIGNAYYLQIDNSCPYLLRDLAAANSWDWVALPGGLNHTAGATHTITLYGYDANVKVDEILLSQSCAPTGTGDNCLSGGTTDTTFPTVSISAPAVNANLRGSSVAVTATASDNVGVVGVQFKLDGANLGTEDTTSPYSITWDTTAAAEGIHSLTAVARDAAGNSTTSASVSIRVDNTNPTGSISAPASSAIVRGNAVTITSNSADTGSGVASAAFQRSPAGTNTWTTISTDTTSPYSASWNTTTLADGLYDLRVITTDNAGNTTTSATITNIRVDNTAPTASISAPAANAALRGTISFSATASDSGSGVASVAFKDGATTLNTDTTSPYAYSWDTTTASAGSHSLTITTTDVAGNTITSAAISITIDNSPPTASMTAPASGATVSGASVVVSATAADNAGGSGIAGVQFYLDYAGDPATNKLGAEDTSSPYSYSWNTTTLADGPHTLTAIARDASGNTVTSATITVTVNNANPPPPDTSPPSVPTGLTSPSRTTTSISLTWDQSTDSGSNATGVAGYKLYRNGSYLLSIVSGLSYTDSGLSPSTTYSYRLSAYDNASPANESAQAPALSVTTDTNPAPPPPPPPPPAPAGVVGDLNGDGLVNIFDLSILLSHYGRTGTGDINSDGSVNIYDLSILLSHYRG